MARPVRGLLPAVLAAAAVLAGDQVSQLGAAVLRSGPADAVWRFQFATLMIGRMVPLVLAVLLAGWGGWAAGAPRVVRGASAAGWGLAAVLLVAVGVLWADGPAARAVLLADQLTPFTRGWVRVFGVGLAGTVVTGAVSWRLGRASRNTTP